MQGPDDAVLPFWRTLGPISVYENLRPDRMIIHGDKRPTGRWFDELFRIIPILEYEYYPLVEEVYGLKLGHIHHIADVARIDILHKYGGMYFDLDVFVVRPMDALRRYDCVVGIETGNNVTRGLVNAGAIVARPGARFLELWREGYRDYREAGHLYNSGEVPTVLLRKNPELVRVSPRIWHDTNGTILNKANVDLSGFYAYHIWGQLWKGVSNAKLFHMKPNKYLKYNNTLSAIVKQYYIDRRH
ncbi:PREDICTED: uncharacterized protein LOC106811085 [Priapulus caudatus]|uniref:Uncharacterized protein LOC106811085 n=1 Tax=Priapulus caudatus TaxID=37621 RepID=A0ABM1ED30_PRICU|nr:PREDICTED: uncharacterized protein LOC106811085 [Priapulus caudatus]